MGIISIRDSIAIEKLRPKLDTLKQRITTSKQLTSQQRATLVESFGQITARATGRTLDENEFSRFFKQTEQAIQNVARQVLDFEASPKPQEAPPRPAESQAQRIRERPGRRQTIITQRRVR